MRRRSGHRPQRPARSARFAGVIGLILLAAPPSHAGAPEWLRDAARVAPTVAPTDADELILYAERRVVIDESGRRSYRELLAARVDRGDGRELTHVGLWEPSWRHLGLIRGWRLDPNGSTLTVEDMVSAESYGPELYSGAWTRSLRVPDCGPGTIFGTALEFSEDLSVRSCDRFILGARVPTVREVYAIETPPGWSVSAYAVSPDDCEMTLIPPTRHEGREWTWEWKDLPAALECSDEHAVDDLRRVQVRVFLQDPSGESGIFRSWSDVAYWSSQLSAHSLSDSAGLRAAAPSGSGPDADFFSRVRIRGEQVRDGCAYRQIYVGYGGWLPHRTTEIWRSRFGDCKDLSHVLVNLLRLDGIEAYPVLVQAGGFEPNQREFPDLAFNHCIAAVRRPLPDSGFIYIDPTAREWPIGELPGSLQNAEALFLGCSSDTGLFRLPQDRPSDNLFRYEVRTRIEASDWSAGCEVACLVVGEPCYRLKARTTDRNATPAIWQLFPRLRQSYPNARLNGTETWDCSASGDSIRIRCQLRIPGYAQSLGKELLIRPDPFWSRETARPETAERCCHYQHLWPNESSGEVRLELGGGWVVASSLPTLDREWSAAGYRSSIRSENGELICRKLKVVDPSASPVGGEAPDQPAASGQGDDEEYIRIRPN